MKEGKFTLRAEKQMVQRVGWSGGFTAEEGPGATPQKPWQTFNLRRTFPPRKNQGRGVGVDLYFKSFIFKTGEFLEILKMEVLE